MNSSYIKLISICFCILFLSGPLSISGLVSAHGETHSRIINGASAQNGEFPFVVSISYAGMAPRESHFCGGILIGPRHVLTAAHCVYDYVSTPHDIQIFSATRLSDTSGVTVPADGITVFPAYRPEIAANDLAIVRLSRAIDAEFIEPVGEGDWPFWQPGMTAIILGWGYTDSFYPVRPDGLQKAEVPIISDEQCAERLGIDFDRTSMLCAGVLAQSINASDGVDSCYGDSGGPLLVNTPNGYKVAGLVSWGLACGSDKYWGVYTRLAAFRDWVLSLPGVAPFEISPAYISGRPEVRSRLRCRNAEWGGDPAGQYIYEWHDVQEGLLQSGPTPSFKLRRSDIGRNLKCSVRAINESGEAISESAETGTVYPNTRKIRLARSSRKTLKALGMTCNPKRCDFLLSLKSLSARHLNLVVLPGGAAYPQYSSRGKALTKDSWRFRVKRGRHRNYIAYIRVVFEDRPSALIEVPLIL